MFLRKQEYHVTNFARKTKYQVTNVGAEKIKLSRLLVQRINEFIHYRFNVKHHGNV